MLKPKSNKIVFLLTVVSISCIFLTEAQTLSLRAEYVHALNEKYGRYKDIHPDARNTPILNHYFATRSRHGVQISIMGKSRLSEFGIESKLGIEKLWISELISFEYGLKSALLGHYARHEVGYTVLGIVDGQEHREYHYQLDNSTMLYLSPAISIGIEVKKFGVMKYGLERSFLINSWVRRRDLYVNNPDGEYHIDDQYAVENYYPFNKSLFLHTVALDIPFTEQMSVTFAHQWSHRSVLKPEYVWYPYAFPFRNFMFGLNCELGGAKSVK